MKFYLNVDQIGNYIHVREYDSERGFVNYKTEFKPTMFVPSNDVNSEYRGVYGEYLDPIEPGNIKETKNFIEKYDDVENFDVYGNNNFVAQFIAEEYPENIEYDSSKIRIFAYDIEVFSDEGFPDPEFANYPVTSISLWDSFTDAIYVFGSKPYTGEDDSIVHYEYASERDLLVGFVNFWYQNAPNLVTGWNTEGFDNPYIFNRCEKILGSKLAKRLSPWNKVNSYTKKIYGKDKTFVNFLGIAQIDYLEIYKKHILKPRESYKLDHIACVELGDAKISYEEMDGLHDLYEQDYNKFIDYNVHDTHLVRRLDEKLQLLELTYTIAYYARINYADTFSPVKTWDVIITNFLMKDNIVVPPKEDHAKNAAYSGAFVKDPITGFHDWVVSFDLDGLYPHLIMQYNLGPDTIVDLDDTPTEAAEIYSVSVDSLLEKEHDLGALENNSLTIAPNGQFFRTDKQGFLPQLMENLYKERKGFKKEMLGWKQEKENISVEKEKRGIK